MRFKRDGSKPLLIPLTPVAVAMFFAVREMQEAPAALVHATRAAVAGVAVVGTYLMTLRPADQRADMAEALSGRRVDPRSLLPVDAATHWFPAAVLAWDFASKPSPPSLGPTELGAVAFVTAALTAAYLRAVDSPFMYQMEEGALICGFMSVYVPTVLWASVL